MVEMSMGMKINCRSMNNKAVLISCLIVLLNLACSQGVRMTNANQAHLNVFAQLAKFENESIGKRLLQIVELQLDNGVSLREISTVIRNIKQDLLDQQQSQQAQQRERNTECSGEYERLNALISDSTQIKSDASELVNLLSLEVSKIKEQIEIQQTQLNLLRERSDSLDVSLATEIQSYNQAIQDKTQVLNTLNIILLKLGELSGDAKYENVMLELAKIGKSNPLLSLIQLSSSLPKESLDIAKQKFKELVESVNSSLTATQQIKDTVQAQHKQLQAQLQGNIDQLESVMNNSNLVQKQSNLDFHQKRFDNAVEAIQSNSEILKRKQNQCADWQSTFNIEFAERTNQLETIDQVQNILATKLEAIKEYFKQKSERNEYDQ